MAAERMRCFLFLDTTLSIPGFLLSVAVDKGVLITRAPANPSLIAGYQTDRAHFTPAVFERMLKTVVFAGSMISSLAHNSASIRILVDDDAIVATPQRREVFVKAMRGILAQEFKRSNEVKFCCCSYITDRALRIAAQDILAIPDLAGGAFSEITNQIFSTGPLMTGIIQQLPASATGKMEYLDKWLRVKGASLTKDLLLVRSTDGEALSISPFELFNDFRPALQLSEKTHRQLARRRRRT